MKTAIAPNLQPDRYDSEEWPALVPDIPDGANPSTEARSLDPTPGGKLGSDPHDDPTRGGSHGQSQAPHHRTTAARPKDDQTR